MKLPPSATASLAPADVPLSNQASAFLKTPHALMIPAPGRNLLMALACELDALRARVALLEALKLPNSPDL